MVKNSGNIGFEVKDSGKRQDFPTGSRRDTNEGKPRPDLIPPLPLLRLSEHLRKGAIKYGERNWERGQPSSRYYESLHRHILSYSLGDNSEDHLSAILFNTMGLIQNEEMVKRGLLPAELLDEHKYRLPSYYDVEKGKEYKIKVVLEKFIKNYKNIPLTNKGLCTKIIEKSISVYKSIKGGVYYMFGLNPPK